MKKQLTLGLISMFIVGALAGCSSNPSSNGNPTTAAVSTSNEVDTDQDGIPDNAEIVLGTNPQALDSDGDGIDDKTDKNPTQIDTVFEKTSGEDGFTIKNVLVENNVDEDTQKDDADHLEVFLTNTSSQDITDFTIYYEFKDQVNGAMQSYELPLRGFVLLANSEKSIHVDTSGKPGHFAANPNSSYYQSLNPKEVTVIISTPGYNSQKTTVQKDKGGAEMAD